MAALGAHDIPGVDLTAVEAAVGHAIRTRDESGLRLLGHGDISIVLGLSLIHISEPTRPY